MSKILIILKEDWDLSKEITKNKPLAVISFIRGFLPARLNIVINNMTNPKAYIQYKIKWNKRPKNIGDLVFYHGDGPFKVIEFCKGYGKENSDFIILIEDKETFASYLDCCSLTKD